MYKRVQVSGAPGYADFEADLIMEIPRVDGVMMSIVGNGGDVKSVEVIESRYVEEVTDVAGRHREG